MSRYMSPVYRGKTASPVASQLSATGRKVRRPELPQSARSVVKGSTPRPSSPRQIKPTVHEYVQDGDRMQCDHCGFWFHLL